MKNRLIKILCTVFSAILLLNCIILPTFAASEENNVLKFKNGKFKILVLSDLQDTHTPRKGTVKLAECAIDKTNPDLIVLLGDNIAGWWKNVNTNEAKAAVDNFAKMIDDKNIPFALVFGNHDHEGLCDKNNGYDEESAKKQLLQWYQNYDNCIAVEGENLTGYCNYNVTIKDSKGENDVFNLWFMDSNPYTSEKEGGGYGYVHEDQTQWYINKSNELKEKNGGKPLPSIVFQHIIVPEVYNILTEVKFGTKGAVRGNGSHNDKFYLPNDKFIYSGELNEGPCSPDVNHGQFDSWLKQGDVIAGVFGHDHTNSFSGKYKGIDLLASPAATYYSYGNNHGVRTILLSERNLNTFSSEVFYFEDVAGDEVENVIVRNFGYLEFVNKFIPIIIGLTVAIILVVVTISLIVQKKKRR